LRVLPIKKSAHASNFSGRYLTVDNSKQNTGNSHLWQTRARCTISQWDSLNV
jgi:hypothetical protein